ncbi:hypothetical protein [Halomonas elongata]
MAPDYQGSSPGKTLLQAAEEWAPSLAVRPLAGYVSAHKGSVRGHTA